ncbi:Werner Syndrome-like exonuclease [Apostasia shenzhenica]|uniref:Werner Syndrome-like exonuclease n=1 Tax=Apostasia shenzhenica TaxID=1088818 RepID=A0A2I0AS51_9ASPA|nr:Werner Syndrome-like exonuclease [Apostasia shenzhenica]
MHLDMHADGRWGDKNELVDQKNTICVHAFSDLSHISPPMFIYLLKECYLCGTRKATQKFNILQQHVFQALYNSPQPGPCTFIVQCLYILPLLGLQYSEGFGHLLMCSLKRLKNRKAVLEDFTEAKLLAAQLFVDILASYVNHEERILIKVLELFEVRLKDIGQAMFGSAERHDDLEKTKAYIERHIFDLIESHSYMTATILVEHFSVHLGESFLMKMMENKQFKAAEKWALFMGKPMICLLVQKYLEMKMLKNAYDVIKSNNLKEEFPEVQRLYKESSLKKLAEKGLWDIAELRAMKDRQLLEFVVYLAMEAGYSEKVFELRDRYSLEGFDKLTVSDKSSVGDCYLDPEKLMIDDILWVDESNGLLGATNYIEGCKVVGIDCEWKPNYEKGSKPNKVSIMQIASENRAYIFDLIKLHCDVPKELDNCFRRILCSPNILKLGYNLQCDLHQLSQSYGDLGCFRYYEMLLDVQKMFNEPGGGLSGLAEKVLGAGLNKTRRNSNWEQRPLSQNQMEYAALDAAVLVHIFHCIYNQPHSAGKAVRSKVEWKSHIVSCMGNAKR